MLVTEKMYDIELDETLNKNNNTNVEIDSKATSNINDNIAKSEDSKDDDMVIDVIVKYNELNENANNNKVENNELDKDKSQETLKDNINENDMVVDRKYDNVNDNISISKPKEKCVDIYTNDNNTNIVLMNNLIYGRFPTDFQPLIRLKSNDKVNGIIPF